MDTFDIVFAVGFIGIGIFAVYIIVFVIPETWEINEQNIELSKSLECEELKEKIYNKDFELWVRSEHEIKHEYEWRCEK